MREPGIALRDRLDQRIDDLALDAVGEVPGIGDVGELAPAVGDLLVLGERVHDEREDAQIRCEGLGQRVRRRLPLLFVRVGHARQRRLQRQVLPVDLETQRGDRLVEKAVPSADAADGLFEEKLLDIVGELMRLFFANIFEPRAVMGERPAGHRRRKSCAVEPIELKFEEQQLAGDFRHALLGVAVELGARRVGGVAGVGQRRIGHQPAHEVLQRLILADRAGQAAARFRKQFAQAALAGGGERLRLLGGAGEIGGELRGRHAGIEMLKPPLRQSAKRRRRIRAFGRLLQSGVRRQSSANRSPHWRSNARRASRPLQMAAHIVARKSAEAAGNRVVLT